MNRREMLQRQHIFKIYGFAACGILVSYALTATVFAQAPQVPRKAPKYQIINVINHGAFVMSAQPSWKCKDGTSGNFPASSKFPVGQSSKWDMADAKGITTGCEMWAHMDIVAGVGSDPDSATVEYAPNGQVVTFEVKGTTFKAWVEKM